MAYDLEKYRDKREKVLGVRKRGLSFAMLATLVSAAIILGLGLLVIPQSIAYLQARNFEDVVYKTSDDSSWPAPVVAEAESLEGIREITIGSDGKRLVITYDSRKTDEKRLSAFLENKGVTPVLLNRINHTQHLNF